ncbi:DUF624 domain-containing protein [Jiangella mangrovi]|uniref:Putative membrane protein YesL n=1 Tax=Jiangella mangrovi TaxID=1524084 RepID=A0A7W9GW40_9ACTN|nr:DUF624 domain-containing protein [Jiangella mangrovi]MBB5791047.1 putative membrane protein YesL [Jiangella mangrovi]
MGTTRIQQFVRVSENTYRYASIAVALVLTTLPGLVGLLLLDRSLGNAPLYALFLLPFAPATSAGLFALGAPDDGDSTFRTFLRGYRMNLVQAAGIGVAALVVLTIIAIGVLGEGRVQLPAAYRVGLVVIAAGVVIWALLALVISSRFAFRTRDVARLAVYYTFRLPLVALGVLGVLVLAYGIATLTFTAVLAFAGPAILWLLQRCCDPLTRDVHRRFVRPGAGG